MGGKNLTKELLEQYPDICAEIKELEQRMREPVTDTVSGSSEDYPYTQHAVSIKGIPPDMAQQREILLRQTLEIESFIALLPESRQRRIAKAVIEHGKLPPWPKIARKLGYPPSAAESLRKTYDRIFTDCK